MYHLAIPVLHTESSKAAIDFYRDTLGFELQFSYRIDEEKEDPCYMGFQQGTACIHVSSFPGDAVVGGAVYVIVEDVDEIHSQLVDKEVTIDLVPTDQSWGNREMYVKDRDGNSIRFVSESTGASDDPV